MAKQSAQRHALRWLCRRPLRSPVYLTRGYTREQVFGTLDLFTQLRQNQRWKNLRGSHDGLGCGRSMRRCDRRRVVWLGHLIGHVLGIDQPVVAADYKDSALKQSPFLDQHAVIAPELLAAMCGKHLMADTLGRLPASLSEGQVHADGVQHDVRRQVGA